MNKRTLSYRGHRFPTEIISLAVWLHYRFSLSFREVEDLLAERGIIVSYEAIRQWCGRASAGQVPATFRVWVVFSSVVTAFRDAADRLSRGGYRACFPEGTFPPGLLYVPTVADLLSGG